MKISGKNLLKTSIFKCLFLAANLFFLFLIFLKLPIVLFGRQNHIKINNILGIKSKYYINRFKKL